MLKWFLCYVFLQIYVKVKKKKEHFEGDCLKYKRKVSHVGTCWKSLSTVKMYVPIYKRTTEVHYHRCIANKNSPLNKQFNLYCFVIVEAVGIFIIR